MENEEGSEEYDKAEAADLVTEEGNPWQGDTVRNLWLYDYLRQLFFKSYITLEQEKAYRAAGPDVIARTFNVDFES